MPNRPQLQDYEILRLLGSGAHGLVYQALDLRSGEVCALKEFPAQGKAVQSFFRELSILFSVDHPNVIRTRNLIYGQNGKHYLVFDYADGGSLRDLLLTGAPLPREEVLEVVLQTCLGLAHIHGLGILHRDLKPENILVCREPRLYKLADLGVACLALESGGSLAGFGSPAYMAPEQFYEGSSPAADLYSLGVIFYELLAGERPFQGNPARLFAAHRSQEPDFSRIEEPAITPLLRRLLAKAPADRPGSADEVIEALEELHTRRRPFPAAAAASRGPASKLSDSPAPLGPPLLHGPVEAEWLQERDTPGAKALWALRPWNEPCIHVTDGRVTDRWDVQRDYYSPSRLRETILAVCTGRAPHHPIFFTTPYFVWGSESEESPARRLFRPGIRAEAIAVDRAAELLALCDRERLYAFSRQGHSLWSVPVRNYFLAPAVMALGEGRIAVSEGPASPAVQVLDRRGRLEDSISLDAPVLSFLPVDADSGLVAVLGSLGHERPARLRWLSSGVERELAAGVYQARAYPDLLVLYHLSGKVLLFDRVGEPLGEISGTGEIVSDCWFPGARQLAVLERFGHRSLIRRARLGSRSAECCSAPGIQTCNAVLT